MTPRRFAPLLLLAVLAACATHQRSGLRPLPEPQKVTVASARAAAQAGNWSLAASSWYELYLRNDETSLGAAIEAAHALAELDDFTSATNLVEEALKRYPNHPDLLEAQGDLLVRAGFRRAAEPYYERALDIDPQRLSVLLSLARARVELDRESAAVPLLERRIALGAGDAESWLLLARAQRAAGNFPRALEAYDKAFELGESRPDRLVYAASLYFEVPEATRRDLEPSHPQRWLERAIELAPQSTRAHELLGRLREQAGDLEGAFASYERAVETDPGDRSTRRRASRLARQLGRYDRAIELGEWLAEHEENLADKETWQLWIARTAAERDAKRSESGGGQR